MNRRHIAERSAAAAAVQDPSLLMRLRAEENAGPPEPDPARHAPAALVFALANAGLHVDGRLLGAALTSPIVWGIVPAYVVGKPLGIMTALLAPMPATVALRARVRPLVVCPAR